MNADLRISVEPMVARRKVEKPHAVYYVIYEGAAPFRMVLHQTVLPGESSPIHVHTQAPELYIVLQGNLQIRTDLGIADVPAGHIALVPAGVPHGVANLSLDLTAVSLILLGADYSKAGVEVLDTGPPEVET